MTVNKNFKVKNGLDLSGVSDTATAATHYYVETATDGQIRPKTLANTKTELVTTASVDAAVDTWHSYTPTWGYTAGSQPTIGNGTLTGAYQIIGKTALLRIRLAPGSTTSFGNSAGWQFSLPGSYPASDTYFTFSAVMVDASTLSFRSGSGVLVSTTSIWVYPSSNGIVGYAVPFTWADGDSLIISGFYVVT